MEENAWCFEVEVEVVVVRAMQLVLLTLYHFQAGNFDTCTFSFEVSHSA